MTMLSDDACSVARFWSSLGFPGGTAAVRDIDLVRLARPDVQSRFTGPNGIDWLGFVAWILLFGRQEFPVLQATVGNDVARHLAALPGPYPDDTLLPVSLLLEGIIRVRTDVAAVHNPATVEGRAGLVRWYLLYGLREHDLAPALSAADLARLQAPLPQFLTPGPLPLTRLACLLWQERGDIRQAFDIDTPEGRQGLAQWFAEFGAVEQGWDGLLSGAEQAWLAEPVAGIPADTGMPVTRSMVRLWETRPELQASCNPTSFWGRLALQVWVLLIGRDGAAGQRIAPEARAWLLQELAVQTADGQAAVPRAALGLWQLRPDVQQAFALATTAGAQALAGWFQGQGRQDYRGLDVLQAGAGLAAPALRRPPALSLPGVNVIGCVGGEFGIGEDVRTIARALHVAGVPVGVVDHSYAIQSRQADASADFLRIPERRYGVDLLAMTPADAVRATLLQDPATPPATRVIGCWPCELVEWPADQRGCCRLVDELWASTRFATAAWESTDTVPVHYLPLAVTASLSRPFRREEFGIAGGVFQFLTIFDAFSNLHRKNPWAVVHGFLRAFARSDASVGLVVKVMNARDGDPEWESFAALCAGDPRIHILRDTLDRERLLGLLAVCDALVSLHRAEGFGRTMGEAMVLGKPVVATAYSGNIDFTLPDNACLVGYRAVPIAPGTFPGGDGQLWAEADVDHAAWHMRRLATDAVLYNRIATRGQDYVLTHHSLEAVGRRYRLRLEEAGVLG
jgi:glycosyltransferase involved in cell wall biosynthesis